MNYKEEGRCVEALGSFSNTSVDHTDVPSILENEDPADTTLLLGTHVNQIQIQASTTASQGGVLRRQGFGKLT